MSADNETLKKMHWRLRW